MRSAGFVVRRWQIDVPHLYEHDARSRYGDISWRGLIAGVTYYLLVGRADRKAYVTPASPTQRPVLATATADARQLVTVAS